MCVSEYGHRERLPELLPPNGRDNKGAQLSSDLPQYSTYRVTLYCDYSLRLFCDLLQLIVM